MAENNNETKLLGSPKKDIKSKADFYIEIALIFILGVLIGIAVKTEAAKKITVGYNDYQIKIGNYNINQLQEDLLNKQNEEGGSKAGQPILPGGGSCGGQ